MLNRFLLNCPIRKKLLVLSGASAVIGMSLLLVCLLFYVWYDFFENTKRNLETLSRIIGNNSAAPLLFDDREAAQEILLSLKSEPAIIGAVLFDREGKVFASYNQPECTFEEERTLKVYRDRLCFFEHIVFDRERIGSICLTASLEGFYVTIKKYSLIALLLFAVALLVALRFACSIQRNISQPILKIVDVASEIYRTKNYRLRVEIEDREDEIGLLARAFNAMLAEIEARDTNLEYLVAQRTRELEEALEHLKKLDRMKSEFISNVSHELRTPLTSVLGFAVLIKKDFKKKIEPLLDLRDRKTKKIAGRIEQNLEIIIKEGKRLTELINNVLDLAKIESGKIEWKFEEMDLREVVEEVVRSVEPLVNEKGLYLRGELRGEDFRLVGDRYRLTQVVLNLVSNAIKFTDQGGITYRLVDEGEEIRCEIEDTGCGIPEDMLEEVFDKFKQVGPVLTDKPKGTGLGLPIAREIVLHHGGRIWVESKVGEGSRFVFVLPRKPGAPSSS